MSVRKFALLVLAILALQSAGCFDDPGASNPCNECLECEVCVEGPAGPQCEVQENAYEQCAADGQVHSFDSCDGDEGVAETCPEKSECTDLTATAAECVCLNHWEGEECNVCLGNWDADQDCDACQTNWQGADCEDCPDNWDADHNCDQCENQWIDEENDCGTCPGNWDPATDCSDCFGNWDPAADCEECENAWIDEGNDCGTCPGNWDAAADCADCVGLWDPVADCQECIGGWDEATDCTTCANNWIDEDDDCGTCPGNWDPEQDCAACFPGWEGPDCETQPDCVRYVDVSSTADEPDGHAWLNAFGSVQEGIDAAVEAVAAPDGPSSCQIWVAEGTYYVYGSSDEDTIALAAEAPLYGGFAGDETALDQRDWVANPTVLDGRESSSSSDRVYHVVEGDEGAVIDGFTITMGRANGSWSSGAGYNSGGGLFSYDQALEIRNCEFLDNYGLYGGGLYLGYSTSVVEDCTFGENGATWGGAIYIRSGSPQLIASELSDNSASQNGGAIYIVESAAAVDGCEFLQNIAEEDGGGIGLAGSTSTIDECTFVANEAWDDGGGIYSTGTDDFDGEPVIIRCWFESNTADRYGGAVMADDGEPNLDRTVFFDNSAWRGGGVFFIFPALPLVGASTFYGNSGSGGGGGAYNSVLEIGAYVNCVFWDNEPDQIYQSLGDLWVGYSVVDGGFDGPGNLSGSPYLTDASGGDFHPLDNSPCIDAAAGQGTYTLNDSWTLSLPFPTADFDGNFVADDPDTPNIGVGLPAYADIGAYEYQP